MRILLIMGASGGVGRHVTDLAYYLLNKKHNVTLVYSGSRNDKFVTTRLNYLDSIGCDLLNLEFNRDIGFKDFFVLVALVKFVMKSESFDVIHGHSSKGGFYSRLLYFFSKAKIIYSPHAFYTMNHGNSKILHLAIRLLEFSMSYVTDKLIVTSLKEMEHLSYLWIKQNKAQLISNGSYNSPFDVNESSRINIDFLIAGSDFTIGFVGRFCYQKNLDLAIEIFCKCVSENPNLKLLMVGFGEDETRIKNLVCSLGLIEKVIFLGEMNCDDVLPLFDALLVTSRYEGSPYLFQDAVKYGIPIISTDVGGVEFFVKNNINGFVFDSQEEAVSSILNLVNDPVKLKRFSTESTKVAKYYSWSSMGNAVMKLYESSKACSK